VDDLDDWKSSIDVLFGLTARIIGDKYIKPELRGKNQQLQLLRGTVTT
jgi:hypothetical protein